jgi:hypothetical protein
MVLSISCAEADSWLELAICKKHVRTCHISADDMVTVALYYKEGH